MSTQYVVITGASKGIGRATALYLDKKGFHVFAGVRNADDGKSLCESASDRLIPLIIDVTNSEQIAHAADQVKRTIGEAGLFGLVNNAGIVAAAPLEFIPVDEVRLQLEVNVVGQLAVTQAFLPMIRQARGRIVNISSIGGRIAGGMLGAYHASKFALEALTDSLRVELRPWGIEVISIEPGQIATPIWETSAAVTDNRLLPRMSPKVNDYYKAPIDKIRVTAATAAAKGLPPEKVAEVIEQALTSARPKTRYLVGTDAKIVGHIISHLPDRLRDRVLASR